MVYIKSEGGNIWCGVCACCVKGFEAHNLFEIFFLLEFFLENILFLAVFLWEYGFFLLA